MGAAYPKKPCTRNAVQALGLLAWSGIVPDQILATLSKRIIAGILVGFWCVESHLGDSPRVIKTAETDTAHAKSLVSGTHDWLVHVVDIDINFSGFLLPDQLHIMPGF